MELEKLKGSRYWGISIYLQCRRPGFDPWVGKIPWRRKWQPTPVLWPGKFHGWRSLEGYCPWGCKELDTTEQLHIHFSLSCIGEGNGNPLQCSCLENPRDRGAWWAAIYGVAQSWTQLKWFSSSSSNSGHTCCVPDLSGKTFKLSLLRINTLWIVILPLVLQK